MKLMANNITIHILSIKALAETIFMNISAVSPLSTMQKGQEISFCLSPTAFIANVFCGYNKRKCSEILLRPSEIRVEE